MNAISGPGVTQAEQRRKDSPLNFIGGVVLGAAFGLTTVIVGYIGLLIEFPAEAWLAFGLTVGAGVLLVIKSVAAALMTRRASSLATGFFIGCLLALVALLFVIIAAFAYYASYAS